jgi:hypothetical protein
MRRLKMITDEQYVPPFRGGRRSRAQRSGPRHHVHVSIRCSLREQRRFIRGMADDDIGKAYQQQFPLAQALAKAGETNSVGIERTFLISKYL